MASPRSEASRRAHRRSHRRSPRDYRPLLRKLVVFLFVLGAAAAIAYPSVRPMLQRWRAQTLVSAGEELARRQRFLEAIDRLKIAVDMDPGNRQGLRTLAGIYSAFDLPEALPVWRSLVGLRDHTEKDAHDFIAFAIGLQRYDLAESELAQLLARTNISQQTRILATTFFLEQNDPARALAFAEDVRRADPADPSHVRRVVRILLATPDPERQREGLRQLADCPSSSSSDRLALYRLLSSTPALPLTETSQFVDRLPSPPDSPPAEFLARSDVLIRLRPGERTNTLGAAVRRLRAGSGDAQAALAAWLNRVGAQAQLLEAYTLEEATRQPRVLAEWLEALAIAGRWTELQGAIATQLPVDAWMLEAFRSAAAARHRQDELAREHWRRAMDETQGNPARIRDVGDFALRIGAEEQALDAFDRLTRNSLHRVIGYRRLKEVYEKARDATRLRALMIEWSAFAPDDPAPDAQFCYLSALLRQDLDKALRRAAQLADRFPTHLGYRAVVAFVELRDNQPAAALQRFERARSDLRHATPQARFVYALVLDANGQHERALEFARDLPAESLLPEEEELFRRMTAD